MKFCVDCVHCTLVYPERREKFYQCGNPNYVYTDPVDGGKTWLPCEMLRSPTYPGDRRSCGQRAAGFLPIVPEIPVTHISRWTMLAAEVKGLWRYPHNFVTRGYFPRAWRRAWYPPRRA